MYQTSQPWGHCSHATHDLLSLFICNKWFIFIVHMWKMIVCHCSHVTNDFFVIVTCNKWLICQYSRMTIDLLSLFTCDKCFLVIVSIPQMIFVFRKDMIYTFLMKTAPYEHLIGCSFHQVLWSVFIMCKFIKIWS